MALDPLTAGLDLGGKLIDRLWPDPAQRDKAKLELFALTQSGELQQLASRAGIVTAEAQSEHWLTANWRPITMLTFVFIIANNYILAPYTSVLFGVEVRLEIPPDMWDLLKLGLGGYVMGRSAEKGIRAWKEK